MEDILGIKIMNMVNSIWIKNNANPVTYFAVYGDLMWMKALVTNILKTPAGKHIQNKKLGTCKTLLDQEVTDSAVRYWLL